MKADHNGIITLLKMADANPESCSISINKIINYSAKHNHDSDSNYANTLVIKFTIEELSLDAEIKVNFYTFKRANDESGIFHKNIAGYSITDTESSDYVIVSSHGDDIFLARDELYVLDESKMLEYCMKLVEHHSNLINPSNAYSATLLVRKKLKDVVQSNTPIQ